MENEFVYRRLAEHEITLGLFSAFERRQVVTKCWRKNGGQWQIQEDPFVDQWDTADYAELVRCLRNTVRTGGVVYGAFGGGVLKGFVSVEAEPLELQGNYLDLTSLHVSEDCRRAGAGTALFRLAAAWAKAQGAEKLYISSHSAAETQAFYRGIGCRDALQRHAGHTAAEPFDCQLEFDLETVL